MALMMMVGTFSTVQAKELVGKDHWKVSFDGSQMTTNFGKDQMNDELSNIQPGDSMTLKVKIENKNSQYTCLLYTSPSPRDRTRSRMPSSA